MPRKGAKEVRNQLSEFLDAAEKGRSTIITVADGPLPHWSRSRRTAPPSPNRR